MQNYIKIKDKVFKAQLIWRNNKNDNTKDDDNKIYPFPKEDKEWSMSKSLLERLKKIQILIETKKPQNQLFHQDIDKNKNCLLCDKKNISRKFYFLDKYLWEDSMIHYIKHHNSKPSDDFIDFIFDIDLDDYFATKLTGRIETFDKINENNNISFLKLDKNQIMILDALMKHGGYTKKYYDFNNKNLSRYSEHAGFLETKNKIVYDIVVSGNTFRVDKGDEEIFLPGNMPDSFKFHYIFHTHPPTPKPGGRATDGIIYEFPSVGDILHFIDHFNMGKTIGSLVMASEGIYNIRKINLDSDKIKINEDKLYKEMRKEIWDVNQEAIKKYGKKFSSYKFYSKIAQDKKFINTINEKLKKYFLYIDFFPRIIDFKGKWIVDTIYIPLYDK
jgi:hypothetical protein